MSHIFISYSRQDKHVVAQFVESLRVQDFIVWQDVSNISAGDVWDQALLDAIEQSEAVVVFWSQTASLSKYVNAEIDHALEHDKLIIPVWLESKTPLRDELKNFQAIKARGFSDAIIRKITDVLHDVAPRIQRQVTDFDPAVPMNKQTVPDICREVIGSREYLIVPVVTSAYSAAHIIAEAGTVVRQVSRIQLIMQNTGATNYNAIVNGAFKAILAAADSENPGEAEPPLVGLYVTGARNPSNDQEYWVDATNVAHYSDMIDTTRKAIVAVTHNAVDTQTFQLFQRTLVDTAFLLGVSLDRWIPLQLYKWVGGEYMQIMNIPPRIPK